MAELGPVEIFALRLVMGVPFLGLVLLIKRVPLRFARTDLVPILSGGAIFTAHFMIQATGIVTTTATNSAWIICISPLAVLLYLSIPGLALGKVEQAVKYLRRDFRVRLWRPGSRRHTRRSC